MAQELLATIAGADLKMKKRGLDQKLNLSAIRVKKGIVGHPKKMDVQKIEESLNRSLNNTTTDCIDI